MTALLSTQSPAARVPNKNSYAGTVRTPLQQSENTIAATALTLTNTSYCTVDTSRVREENRERTHPGIIREAIERSVRNKDKMESWRYVAVTYDMRSGDRVRIPHRSHEEMKLVREVAEKVLVERTRVLRDQLHPKNLFEPTHRRHLEKRTMSTLQRFHVLVRKIIIRIRINDHTPNQSQRCH